MTPAAESSIHSSIRARPQRNTTQVQINCKLTIQLFNLGLFIHHFCARVEDKSFNLTTGAARFKWLIIKQQANYAKITGRTADADHEFTHSFSFTPSSELYECHTRSATFETTSLEMFSLEMCYFRTHRIAAGDELRAARGQPRRRRIVELVNNCYCSIVNRSCYFSFHGIQKYSHSFIKVRLNHWRQMDNFDYVFHTFLGLDGVI